MSAKWHGQPLKCHVSNGAIESTKLSYGLPLAEEKQNTVYAGERNLLSGR